MAGLCLILKYIHKIEMKAILTLLTAFAPIFLFAQLDTDAQLKDQDISGKATVINDDHIVQGSACTGVNCEASESFGFDTHRYREDNLRIHFQDNSSSASFPTNDWRIIINDSGNGGEEHFTIEDADSGNDIFRIDAGASANSIRINSNGDVGIGESSPILELHIQDGDSPAIRIEQDGSNGFASQSWDLAGNETNFFIRDVNNSSVLPFKVKPGSISDAVVIGSGTFIVNDGKADYNTRFESNGSTHMFFLDASENKIAIGHDTPVAMLDIAGNIKIADGSEANGYVLTSDADGVATWTPTSASLPGGGTNGQVLSTDGSGNYSWINDNTIDNDNDSSNEIELPSGGSNGQILSTDGSGNYSWINDNTVDNDNDHTNEIELPSGGSNGQILSTDGSGNYSWINDNTIDNDNDSSNEIELPSGGSNGQILSTDGSGNYSWINDNTVDNDNDDTNEIELPSGGSNGQILSTDGSGNYSWITDNTADNDNDPNNEIELPAGGLANQMLMTDGSSNHSWNYVEFMSDADANTKIQVEENSNENKIRFDVDGTEAMIIDEAGNVGIGTDMPEYKLHVDGDIAKTGSLVGVSDLRLKDNISSISNARSIINSLDGKAYIFKGSEFQDLNLPSGTQYGFIAQDVERVIADLVTDNVARTTNDNGEEISLKGVNYEQLIPILVNALKEQDQLIKKQNQEMIEMKSLLNKVLEKLEME